MQRMVRITSLRKRLTTLTRVAVYVNNHTEVWGSWFDPNTGDWGYACCHSSVHVSYCTGQAGIEAARASSAQHLLASSSSTTTTTAVDAASSSTAMESEAPSKPPPEELDDRKKKADELFSKRRLGEGDVRIDEGRLAAALKEERKRKAAGEDDDAWGRKKKTKGETAEVTEEELGASFRPLCEKACVADVVCRGVSDEPEQDGGSYGELCGRGLLRTSC